MFKTVLIANRGEIACRVIDTCRALGIRTVAVYSEADRNALHVEMADESYLIGPPPAAQSYLRADVILEAAIDAGADAVHPGYGFLSENAKFAEAAEKAGVAFIGPPASAICAMGGKSEAKALMEKAGVPLVPGYHGDKQDLAHLKKEAKKIGYPVLIKASAGGGGKGMRIVKSEKEFKDALESAKREAKASFGDDHVLVEKYLEKPRHVEIQVFADTHGDCVYLFERDCSIQRRHQKVIEEAPAPGLTKKTRAAMGEAAVAAAKAIDYVGAGTVEFLYDDGDFYFMEMNTRLQVEHPVTEMITGQDLVEWQLRVASGQKLPMTQDELAIDGHAIEARIYAEDPYRDFMPMAGAISYLRWPHENPHIRIDTGVRDAPFGEGDVISVNYDPMIAKLIVHGADRDDAIQHLQDALRQLRIAGLRTNTSFLRAVASHKAFEKAKLTTKFIEKNEKDLLPAEPPEPPEEALALAAVGVLHDINVEAIERGAGGDPYSPWNDLLSWRIDGMMPRRIRLHHDGGETELYAYFDGSMMDPVVVLPDGREIEASYGMSEHDMSFNVLLNGHEINATVVNDNGKLTVLYDGGSFEMTWDDPLKAAGAAEDGDARLTAPMPGRVVAVNVASGDEVKKGQALIIIEAMKMEHTIVSPADGVVDTIAANVGDQVDESLVLISFAGQE